MHAEPLSLRCSLFFWLQVLSSASAADYVATACGWEGSTNQRRTAVRAGVRNLQKLWPDEEEEVPLQQDVGTATCSFQPALLPQCAASQQQPPASLGHSAQLDLASVLSCALQPMPGGMPLVWEPLGLQLQQPATGVAVPGAGSAGTPEANLAAATTPFDTAGAAGFIASWQRSPLLPFPDQSLFLLPPLEGQLASVPFPEQPLPQLPCNADGADVAQGADAHASKRRRISRG